MSIRSRIRSWIPRFRTNDLIWVDADGFWKPRSHQSASLRYTADLFNEIQGKVIVEVGSGVHGPMAGNSIIVWATKTEARRILAVDMDENRIDEVRAATGGYGNVEPCLADGRDVIKAINDPVDLLYLDFWVEDAPGEPLVGQARADAYLDMYQHAREKLNKSSLILIDDTDHIDPWKQTLIIPEARKDGFHVVYAGRQTLLRRR